VYIIVDLYMHTYIVVAHIMINFIDIDECKLFNGGCEHDCTNNNDSFFCTCHDGYTLKDDHLSCVGMC